MSENVAVGYFWRVVFIVEVRLRREMCRAWVASERVRGRRWGGGLEVLRRRRGRVFV